MRDKKEILLTPAKTGVGLSETERLEVGRLMLKAGYRVTLVKRRPPEKRLARRSTILSWTDWKESYNAGYTLWTQPQRSR